MGTFIRFPEKISFRKAKEKVEYYCVWGNVFNQYRASDPKEVEIILAKNDIDINKIADYCRDYKKPMPRISDMLSATNWIKSGRGIIQISNSTTGQKAKELSESGILSTSTYQNEFKESIKAKNAAVDDDFNSYNHILNALTSGFSTIEAYLNMKAEKWNFENPKDTLIDNSNIKVNIETKIMNWIPKMCNGKSIQTDTHEWSCFKELKNLRDNHKIHPKQSTIAITYKEIAKIIDKYRYGIGLLLANMHICFDQKVPNLIIDTIFYPDIEVIK